MLELHDYYIATLFDKLNPLFYIISLTFFMLFFFGRSYRTIGRLIEICFWPLVIGIAFTLLLPISDVRLFNLLPLMEDGIYPIYQSLIRTSFAYGDYMILFLLMGNISYSAKPIKKILIYMSSMLNFIFDFYLIFVGTFETTTINQSLALGELPLHNPNPTTIGRLEWLTVIMWTGILLIQLSIIGSSCSKCLQEIFGLSDRKWTVYVVTILVVVGYFATYLKLEKLITIATSWVFVGIANGFHVFCISLLYIAYFVLKRRERSYKPIKTKGGLREKNYQQTY